MDSTPPISPTFPKAAMDLEKELTCSICTELLYQPLTLLDCLHTFCGACVKEWFSFQAERAESNPTPPAPGAAIFTCPSCRDSVRSTRHNATVATLLDMLQTAQPEKRRTAQDVAEMDSKYRPGDNVLPRLHLAQRTAEQERLDAEERRMIEEVRALSLQEAGMTAHHRHHSRESSRSQSQGQTQSQPSQHHPYPRSGPASVFRRQAIEHQSSLRSLISRSDQASSGLLDIDREIEEFARQIQEEGILDGLDLDNIDLSNNDELSRRIAEAYRRRQQKRGRSRSDGHRRRSSSNAHVRTESTNNVHMRTGSDGSYIQAARLESRHRSGSHASHSHDRSRSNSRTVPPGQSTSRPARSSTTHLEVRDEPRHHRRSRTASEGRSSQSAAPVNTPSRSGTYSQTDLRLPGRSEDGLAVAELPVAELPVAEVPVAELPAAGPSVAELPATTATTLPFHARVSAMGLSLPEPDQGVPLQSPLAEEIVTSPVLLSDDIATLTMSPPPMQQPTRPPAPPPMLPPSPAVKYVEPNISCDTCGRPHIEYDVHYNCAVCQQGDWNICLDCYRRGRGCHHWFGFGYAAWHRWELARQQKKKKAKNSEVSLPRPHMLTANRYTRPDAVDVNGSSSLPDPQDRLQSGVFCARCQAWALDCFWRCDVCNEGDWGFCHSCVSQGFACTHPLLPLTHVGSHSGRLPRQARLLQPADGSTPTPHIGTFRPLTFAATTCDMCRQVLPPTRPRFHCYTCRSSMLPEPHTRAGDYDLCGDCYAPGVLVAEGNLEEEATEKDESANDKLAVENGPEGWRRCPAGHRMVVVVHREDGGDASTKSARMQRRVLLEDLVGGRRLEVATAEDDNGLQTWYVWYGQQRRYERLVAKDVRVAAPPPKLASPAESRFPPSGGIGRTAVARWAWYPEPGADDELTFPKNAEIREIEDVNGEWFYGVYMGQKGLFPGGYVKLRE